MVREGSTRQRRHLVLDFQLARIYLIDKMAKNRVLGRLGRYKRRFSSAFRSRVAPVQIAGEILTGLSGYLASLAVGGRGDGGKHG